MPNIQQMAKVARTFFNKNSTTILTIAAIGSGITAVVLAFEGGSKAGEILKQYKEDLEITPEKELPAVRKETAKQVILAAAPAVVSTIIFVGCIAGLNGAHTARYEAVSAAYMIADRHLNEWREKTREIVGNKKTEEIKTAIYEDRAKEEPKYVVEGNGTYPILDSQTGTLIYSTIENVDRAINDLQRELNNGLDFVSINDIYYKLEARPVGLGKNLGWNMGEKIDIDRGYGCNKDGIPCMILDYEPHEKCNFWGDHYHH